jgi:histidyl-tRNA synthetase
MNNKIKPTILKGTRDFLPRQMMRRNAVMDIFRNTFEQFGYAPIETPILNPAETILGKYGDEGDRLTYSFVNRGKTKLALPYDLTVPFARFVAANYQNLPIPFKRYQIQRVWRAERPQKGRLREFYQCDIDVIGSKELVCEAELAKVIVTVFDRLRLTDITIKVNTRRLLNAVLAANKVSEDKVVSAIRIIDKLDKVGEGEVIGELEAIGVANAKVILDALKPELTNKKTLAKLTAYDTSELATFLSLCKELGVPEGKLKVDPTLARGLDYYTGLTFEVVSNEAGLGSICGGGRYDNLCASFSDQDFSGVGVSFGFERIMILLEELNLFGDELVGSQALVTIFDEDSMTESLRIYENLIAAGIPAEIYLGTDKLAKQFKFADKKGVPFVVIQGPDEREASQVTVKRMDTGKQKTLPLNQLAAYLGSYYEAK